MFNNPAAQDIPLLLLPENSLSALARNCLFPVEGRLLACHSLRSNFAKAGSSILWTIRQNPKRAALAISIRVSTPKSPDKIRGFHLV
jgi:hypothetical protein